MLKARFFFRKERTRLCANPLIIVIRPSQFNVPFPIALPLVKVGRSFGQKKKEKGNEHLKGPGEFSDGNYFPLSYKVIMTHFDSFFPLYQFWEFKRVVNRDILKAAAGVFKVADESLNVLFIIFCSNLQHKTSGIRIREEWYVYAFDTKVFLNLMI